MRSLLLRLLVPAVAIAGLAACDSPTRPFLDPVIATDTVLLALPSSAAALPSAVDLASAGGVFGGVRFPERPQDATRGYDLLLRQGTEGLVFLPAGATGLFDTDVVAGPRVALPGVSEPRGESFEAVTEAPESRSAYRMDAGVPVVPGGVYIVRTRGGALGCAATLPRYAKLRVLEVTALPAVRLEIVGNGNCNDPRLVPTDDG